MILNKKNRIISISNISIQYTYTTLVSNYVHTTKYVVNYTIHKNCKIFGIPSFDIQIV